MTEFVMKFELVRISIAVKLKLHFIQPKNAALQPILTVSHLSIQTQPPNSILHATHLGVRQKT